MAQLAMAQKLLTLNNNKKISGFLSVPEGGQQIVKG